MFKKSIYLYICFFISLTIITAQKKAFTIQDYYKVKYVSSPVLSHNSKQIAFTVTASDLEKAESNTAIYISNIDGSNLKRLTSKKSSNFNPVWDHNDNGIYFSSYRSGKAQLYYLSLSGGEAEQITKNKLGVASPKLSADGEKFIFQTKVFPECGVDQACNGKISKAMKNGPVQAHIADSLFIRHWTQYADGKYTHILAFNKDDGKYTDLTPGYFNSPTFAAGGSDNYNFSPDGKRVVFDSKRVADPEASTNSDIYIVNFDGTGLKDLTSSNKASDSNPKFSPDGKYIAYLTQKIPRYESDRFRLAIINVKSGERKILTDSFDNWVNDFKWSPDSKSIYFTGYQKGYLPLFNVNISTLQIKTIIPDIVIRGFAVTNDNQKIVYSYSRIDKPVDLAVFNIKNSKSRDITFFNKKLENEIDIRPAEKVWVKGADEIPVEVFIIKPHNFDPNKKYPLIINVHGGPQYQWMDSFRGDWQVYPGAGYVLAFPNPHGSTGYGQKYTAEISGDWDGKVFTDVMKVTDYLEKLPYVDKNKMGAMGWSYGGYFMNLLQAKTHRFKCLVSMMGIYDLAQFKEDTEELWFPNWDLKNKDFEKMSPSKYTDNFATPTLIITGERDYRIPYTQSIRYFTVLQNKGIDSRLIIFKNDGHWPSNLRSMPLYYNAHLEWFHKYLGGKAAPWDSKKLARNLVFDK